MSVKKLDVNARIKSVMCNWECGRRSRIIVIRINFE
jgi:hypothetical protein